MTISSLVAKIGVNPYFIAANAHAWFSFSIILVCHGSWIALVSVAIIAAIKEFYFDCCNDGYGN